MAGKPDLKLTVDENAKLLLKAGLEQVVPQLADLGLF